MSRRFACLAFAALMALGGSAIAQSASRADQLFGEARELMKVQNFKDALPKFEESLKLDPAPGTLFNLAECEAQVGRLVSAKEHFQVAAAGFPKGDKRRPYSIGRVAELERRIAHLTLKLASNAPKDVIVTRNGVPMKDSEFGAPFPTDPGDVALVVTARGHEDRKVNLSLKDGEALEYALQVGDTGAEQAADTTTTDRAISKSITPSGRGTPLRTIGFVVGGVGVLGVGLGAVTGILTMGYASTVKDHCDASNACDSKGLDAASSGKVTSPISTIAFIAGGALIVTGVVLVIVGGSSKKEAPRASFAPVITPFGGTASIYGSF